MDVLQEKSWSKSITPTRKGIGACGTPAQYSFLGLYLAHLVLTYISQTALSPASLGTEDCGYIAG